MNLDHRRLDRRHRIAQRDRRMGVAAGIEDDRLRSLALCASCSQSISWPSWLDWRASSVTPQRRRALVQRR